MADEQQCVFCAIAAGKIPAKKVYEDVEVTVVLDINPAVEGHMLVIPKKHAMLMNQLDDNTVAHLGMVSKHLSQAAIRAFKAEGTSVFVQNGPAAGQRAPHFMLHVIPRKKGDGVVLQPQVVKLDPKALEQTYGVLAQGVAKVFGKEPPKPLAPPPKAEAKPEPKQDDSKKQEDKQTPKDVPPASPQPSAPKKHSTLDDISSFLLGGKR